MHLLDTTDAAYEALLESVLRAMGERYGVDRVILRWAGRNEELARVVSAWSRRSDLPLRDLPLHEVPWLVANMRSGIPVFVDSIDDFPAEAAVDRGALESQGLRAICLVPMTIEDGMLGALALTCVDEFKWTAVIRDEITSLAPVIASAYWGATFRRQLLESEARYRAVVEDQTELIVRFRPDGITTWANERLCEYLGLPFEDVVGRKQEDGVLSQDWPESFDTFHRLTPENPTDFGRYQVTLKSGQQVWQEWTDRGIFDDAGKLIEIQSVGRDITDRVAAENALRESEARYRGVVEDQTDFIVRWTPDGVITWVNDRCCNYLNKSRDELVGSRDLAAIFGGDWHAMFESIARLTPDNPTDSCENRVTLPSGEVAWQERTDRGIFDDAGKLIEVQSIGRDVTTRKMAEEALHKSESRYRDLVQSSTDQIWEANLELDEFFSNNRLSVMLGYPEGALTGVPIDDITHPDDLQELRNDIPILAAQGKGWQRRLLRYRHKDGSYRYLESTATPTRDDDGEVCGFRGVDRDVTGEYAAAEEIRSNEALIKLLLELINDAVFSLGDDNNIDDCNPRAEELLGLSRDALIGQKPWVFSPEFQPDGTASETKGKRLIQRARQGDPAHFDWLHEAQDGSPLHVQVSMSEVRTREGSKLIAVLRDTTKLRQANEELEHRALFEARIGEISARFLNARPEQTDQVMTEVLESLSRDYESDRIDLTWFSGTRSALGQHFSFANDADSNPGASIRVTPDKAPWSTGLIRNSGIVKVDDIAKMGAGAEIDRSTFAELGYSSVLCLPLLAEQELSGVLALFRREQKNWNDTTVSEMQPVAAALASAVIRQRTEFELSLREKDLARSQEVAGVGSFKLRVKQNEDDSLELLHFEASDQTFKIFRMDPARDATEQLLAGEVRHHPDDEARVRRAWRDAVKYRSPLKIEHRSIRPDGSVLHVQTGAQFDSIDDRGVITVFGTSKDITEWVESNEKLQTALEEIGTLKDQLQEENIYLRDEIRAAHGFDKIIGKSPALKDVLAAIEQVAPTDVTVLVTGETGTGKELVSQSIHDLSHRKDKPMISVNCAALSPDLIESELFGHEKGAFTGAHERRKGRFELADGGTLFLDEMGELSGDLQAKLLRVIQEGEFERLGGSKTLRTDVRIIAATNRDLHRAVDEGVFRADLFYRINSFPIHIPPLRERKDDIPLLAEYLVRKHAKKLDKEITSISGRTLRYMRNQSWPGNVRELEGVILRALIAATGPSLDYGDDATEPDPQVAAIPASAGPGTKSAPTKRGLLDAQRAHIISVLEQTHWVIEGKQGAAYALGLAPSSLRSKMKRLDIVRPVTQ